MNRISIKINGDGGQPLDTVHGRDIGPATGSTDEAPMRTWDWYSRYGGGHVDVPARASAQRVAALILAMVPTS